MMGHMVGKDIYRKLGKKIDNLTMRVPWTDSFYDILKELYTTEEAELIIKMPYGLSAIEQIESVTGYEGSKLKKTLDSLCGRGLVIDIWTGKDYRYIISPLIIGIFEFTMMRTGEGLNTKEWAKLFYNYLNDENTFYKANFKNGQKVMPLRTLPHEEAIYADQYLEVLDYEKATSIIENSKKFAIGICSCRHEKEHLGKKECNAPLEVCSTFDGATNYMIRHNFAREISKTEMLENVARSKEMGLVLCADNVKKNVSFICHCCGCCCNALAGIAKFGYPNAVVTSSFIAENDHDTCAECGICAEVCPVKAITMQPDGKPEIDLKFCIGCGVCGLKCTTESVKLVKRKQRVLHPEDTFEKAILQCLERGTLQNLLFNNPQSITHTFMRGFVGAFLKLPPMKKSLMSDGLRSRFLEFMKRGG
jgi:Pyruvate/2-oxoacid:ferredoxin oxidoreductase delta subunit